jgi:hypothetical protein
MREVTLTWLALALLLLHAPAAPAARASSTCSPSSPPGPGPRKRHRLRAASWNVAAVNNNPFEYWVGGEDTQGEDTQRYSRYMQSVARFIDNPHHSEEDVPLAAGGVFTETMFQELIADMQAVQERHMNEFAHNLQSTPRHYPENFYEDLQARWRRDFSTRRIVSQFLKDDALGKKRLASMPDRMTNTIHVSAKHALGLEQRVGRHLTDLPNQGKGQDDDGTGGVPGGAEAGGENGRRQHSLVHPDHVAEFDRLRLNEFNQAYYRPSVINCYDEDMGTVSEWWEQWRNFMFHTRLGTELQGQGHGFLPYELLSPIKASKYPLLTADEEKHSLALQTLSLAIFDAILVHIMNRIDASAATTKLTSTSRLAGSTVSVESVGGSEGSVGPTGANTAGSWQQMRKEMCAALCKNKAARTMEILYSPPYLNMDVIFLQEVSADVVSRLSRRYDHHPEGVFEVLVPKKFDEGRNQNSVILLKKKHHDGHDAHADAHDVRKSILTPPPAGHKVENEAADDNYVDSPLRQGIFDITSDGAEVREVTDEIQKVMHQLEVKQQLAARASSAQMGQRDNTNKDRDKKKRHGKKIELSDGDLFAVIVKSKGRPDAEKTRLAQRIAADDEKEVEMTIAADGSAKCSEDGGNNDGGNSGSPHDALPQWYSEIEEEVLASAARGLTKPEHFLLVSFHGDTNGLSSVPVVNAVQEFRRRWEEEHEEEELCDGDTATCHYENEKDAARPRYHGERLQIIMGMDANTYGTSPGKGKGGLSDFLAAVRQAKLTTFVGDVVPADFPDEKYRRHVSDAAIVNEDWHTTFNARTHLQPQLNKAVPFENVAMLGDRNLKDFIVFDATTTEEREHGQEDVWEQPLGGETLASAAARDNTGRAEYIEGMTFPTVDFPSDHAIVSAEIPAARWIQ